MFFSSISPLSMKPRSSLSRTCSCTARDDGDAARLRDALDARRNIHAVAHQVVALDHDVADMNADAQRQAPQVVGFLYRLGAAHRLNGAGELDQEAVAH